jgi:cytochrome c5
MNKHIPLALLAVTLLASTAASADDGDWKRGRLYYRSVCTSCHVKDAGGSIAPTTMTKAQWAAYLKADKHAKGKDSVKKYISQSYRNSIAGSNKLVAKMLDVSDADLMNDISAFVMKGAKDGDAPASCN